MWVLFDALLSVFGSARRVEAELSHHIVWDRLRSLIVERFPSRPERWLPSEPMRRHHYLYGRNRYLTQLDVLDRLGELHRQHAVDQARSCGLLDPAGPGSWTHPDLSRVVYADGKVVTPLFRARPGDRRVDTSTGVIRCPRVEPDASLHFEGTGEMVWGTKFVLVAARGISPNSRFVLDVAWVPTSGGEAGVAVDSLSRLAPLAPGAQAVVYDTALRGVHHQHLLRHLGLMPVNRVTAAAGSRQQGGGRSRRRIEKMTFVETKTVRTPTGERQVRLLAHGGRIGLGELSHTGEQVFLPLERFRTHRNRDKSGRFRWYNDYRLPADYGGGVVTVRLHGDAEDARRKFNRTENVRPIPPGDPDFERLYRRRNDAESMNRHFDDTLWLRRAHSVGHRRQLLNMLTYALGVNALALHLHRRDQRPATAA